MMHATNTRKGSTLLIIAILGLLGVTGCKRAAPPASKDLVGQWRLVKAGGKSPANFHIKWYIINLNADGTWTSAGQTEGGREGINLQGAGTWALTGEAIAYTSGSTPGTSTVKLSGAHLTLDPDFILHEGGNKPVSGEYER